MSFFKELGKVARFAIPGYSLYHFGKKAFGTPAGAGQHYFEDILKGGGFKPGEKEGLTSDISRQLGAQTNLQRALLNERLAATPGASGTAFGDAVQNQLVRGQQDALQNALSGLNQLGFDRQTLAAQTLYGGQQRSAERKAGILGGLISGAGSVAAAASSKDYKENIKAADPAKLLQALNKTKVKKFRYKKSRPEDDGRTHVGVLAEEAPQAMLADAKHISIPDSIGLLLGAVKALSGKIDKLENR